LGLFDVLGNAGEWCHDESLAFIMPPLGRPRLDSPPREINGDRVGKGGSLLSDAYNCRLSRRFAWGSLQQYHDVGFRVARTLPDDLQD
jgi:formylglycine-generating enzyme required for sulfatase activity